MSISRGKRKHSIGSQLFDEATGGLDSGVLAMRNAERARRGRPPLVELACRYRGQVTLNGFYGAP